MQFRRALVGPVVLIWLAGCGNSGTQPRPVGENLIVNHSFEVNGQPTIAGWRLGNAGATELIHTAPPGGGAWSLKLTADWAPTTSYAVAPVASCRDGDTVRLTALVRAYGPFGGGGRIGLVVAPHAPFGLAGAVGSASTDDPDWTQLTVERTLTMQPGDSLWVVLSSFVTEIVPYEGLFDSVVLEREPR